jgi:membrane-associated protease RseP (regulator of RpoE activity)
MAYALGIALFAFAILVSVCLHEAGHMITAKSFGMKVTKYFAGFGPTLWSFRKGETEYGVKAIPLGGFVKIIGMTPQDEDVDPATSTGRCGGSRSGSGPSCLSAGSITHFILGFVILWITASFVGMPNPALADPQPAVINVQPCVIPTTELRECRAGDPVSPASKAGLQSGDKIISVSGTPVNNWDELLLTLRNTKPGPATIVVDRGGVQQTINVDLAEVERQKETRNADGEYVAAEGTEKRAALGVGLKRDHPARGHLRTRGGLHEVGRLHRRRVRRHLGGDEAGTGEGAALWASLTGSERDPNTRSAWWAPAGSAARPSSRASGRCSC